MNIYEILTLSYGNSEMFRVQAYDASAAIMCTGKSPNDVISLKLIGSANVINNTSL